MFTASRSKNPGSLTWHVWQHSAAHQGPTGPWVYRGPLLAGSEDHALETARFRYDLHGRFMVYPGLDHGNPQLAK